MIRPTRKRSLARLIERCLREGNDIEIDGLGSFHLKDDRVIFEPTNRTQVFIAYAKEDRAEARKLYRALKDNGFEPWMDEKKLLPGQNWPRAIERAIERSDYVVMCFSPRSVGKRGYFQSELRYALDLAMRLPLDQVFLLPVRLGNCEVPHQISRQTQYVDLFPDWGMGIKGLLNAMTKNNG